MIVRVRLFAVARQAAGCNSIELELPDGCTVAQLRDRLGREVPELSATLGQMMFAVDAEYAADSDAIRPGADVACIPPVSGG